MNRTIFFIVGLLAACMGTPALALTPPIGWTAADGDRAVLDAAHPEKGMVLEFRIEDGKGVPEEVVSALQKKGVTIERFGTEPNGHINLVGEEHLGRAKVYWASPTVAVWLVVIASSEHVKSLDPDALLMSLQAAEEEQVNQGQPEELADLDRREPNPDVPKSRSLAFSATAAAMGTAGGVVGGYIGGVTICEISGFGGGVWGMDCLFNPVVHGGTVLTGLAGGYLAYKNSGTVLTLVGALAGTGVGMALWLPSNNDDTLIPVVLLSAGVGGYIGHRLWKVRAARRARYSLSPYWDQERSGLMVFGQF